MMASYDGYWEESNDAYVNINYDEPYSDPAHYEEDDYCYHHCYPILTIITAGTVKVVIVATAAG